MFDAADNLSPVFLPNPLNRHHALNQGLVAKWLALTGLDGGKFWYDIAGLNHVTLTNMTTNASGWRGTSRPGGYGHLLFDGVDDFATITSSAFNTTDYTITAWIKIAGLGQSGTNHNGIVSHGTGGTAGHYFFYVASSTSKLTLDIPFVVGGVVTGATALSTGIWYHVALTKIGNVYTIFVNGVADGTATNSSAPTLSGPFTVGAYGTGFYLNGTMDSVTIWGRGFAPLEIKADYDLSRLGHPGVLNRLNPTRFFSVPRLLSYRSSRQLHGGFLSTSIGGG